MIQPPSRPIRVAAIMEGAFVTGPAKNLFAFARHAARTSANVGVELSLITYQRGSESYPLIEAARQAGIRTGVIHEKRAFEISILRDLRRLVRELQPDIIQTHNIKSHFLVRLLGLHRERPWIAFHHGYVATAARVHLYNQLDRWSLRAPDRIVTVCEAFAEQLRHRGIRRSRITVRHNMVPSFSRPAESEITELRKQLGIPPGTIVIVAAGRLSQEKGHLDLIEAVAILKPGPEEFRLILAGEGPERVPIEKLCRKLDVTTNVHLAGQQPRLAPYYALADMMVLPSHSEGSPNVLLEAMAAGVACVATSVGGVPEIAVDEQNALLVPSHNPRALADAMARLMRDPSLRGRLAHAGLNVTSRFTPEAYCESMISLYESVLESRLNR